MKVLFWGLFSDKRTSQLPLNTLESPKIERPFYFAIIPTLRGKQHDS
jgi:hypothetical protein